jgi:hypothetical protein
LEEYDGEHGRTPLPYRVTFTPRHDRVQMLLEAEQEVTDEIMNDASEVPHVRYK